MAAHADHIEGAAWFAHAEKVAPFQIYRDLAVNGEHDGFFLGAPLGLETDGDLAVIRNNNRPHAKFYGTERHQNHAFNFRVNDGPSAGKRVSRGACWSCYDEAVGAIVGEFSLIDGNLERNEPRKTALINDRVIHGKGGVIFFPISIESDAQQKSFILAKFSLKNFRQARE